MIGRSARAYRMLLRFLPPEFRRRNAGEMELVFAEALAEGRGGTGVLLRTWVSAVKDVLLAAALVRRGRRVPGRLPDGEPGAPPPRRGIGDGLMRDARLAVRGMARAPGFTAVAVVTIGLGIGATALVFSVVHGVLLRPLPYADADRLVNVWNDLIEERQFLPAVHPADFRDYKVMSETFADFAAASGAGQVGMAGVLTGDGPPMQVDLTPITHNFFSLLGIDPVLGRHFTQLEEQFNGPQVAIISHGLWTSRFGADSAVVGRSIQLDGRPFTVVGVLPRGFRLLLPEEAFLIRHADVWVPLQTNYESLPPRNWTWYTVLGRLRPDVSLAEAQAEMDRIAEELRATYPAHAGSGMQIRLVPFHHDIVKQAGPALWTLFGAVGLVLLISCANVAHLLLLRAGQRGREIAVRTALGAGRRVIARQVLVESVALGLLGAAVGVVFAAVGLSVLDALQPANLPRLDEVGLNGTVLAFAASLAVVTAIVFGVGPALHSARADVTDYLRSGSRSGGSKSAGRLRNALVVGEIAFSMVLLIGSGLMVRSFQALQEVRPGFDPAGVLTFRLRLPRASYADSEQAVDFYRTLRTSLMSLPGVEAVGAGSRLPLTGSGVLWPYAYDEATAEDFNLSADGRTITPGYFDAMGTRVLAGRAFDETDRPGERRVVIVEEMLARRAWPDTDPIGQQLQLSQRGDNRFATVVGVVEHTRVYDLTRDVREHIYVPHAQRAARNLSVAVRTAGDPLSVAAAVREAVWALDPDLPVTDLRPMSLYVEDAMAQTRFILTVLSVFGFLALALASIGIYGVISFAVGQRTREFGIRIALGAHPRRIVSSVTMGGARLVAASLAVGVVASALLTRWLAGLLYGVTPIDVLTYVSVSVVFFAVATAACYLPARRTASTDPVSALRSE